MNQSGLSDYQNSGCIDFRDAETLRELYWDRQLSTVQIAELADVVPSQISYWMEKHGIDRRDRIEAVQMERSSNPATYSMTGGGYMEWAEQCDGERSSVRVCRLLAVAEYGFDAVQDKHVRHKNEIPWLDHADNIELLEPDEHLRHHSKGDNNPQAKITEAEAERIRELAQESNMTQSEIGEMFDISQGHVSDLKRGNRR